MSLWGVTTAAGDKPKFLPVDKNAAGSTGAREHAIAVAGGCVSWLHDCVGLLVATVGPATGDLVGLLVVGALVVGDVVAVVEVA